jgi:hypothetical protein
VCVDGRLGRNWWLGLLMVYLFFDPFKSHWWLSLLGAGALGVVLGTIEMAIRKL